MQNTNEQHQTHKSHSHHNSNIKHGNNGSFGKSNLLSNGIVLVEETFGYGKTIRTTLQKRGSQEIENIPPTTKYQDGASVCMDQLHTSQS
eukprot:5709872-Amphidinium_carterae.1